MTHLTFNNAFITGFFAELSADMLSFVQEGEKRGLCEQLLQWTRTFNPETILHERISNNWFKKSINHLLLKQITTKTCQHFC